MFKCPHKICGEKSFKLSRYLNYHLKNVHGTKENVCEKCNTKFALKWQLKQHQKDCGMKFKCLNCDASYERWLTLIMHCKRKGHNLPESGNSKLTSNSDTSNQQPSKAVIYLIPVIQNPPKPDKKSVSTDTNDLEKQNVNIIDTFTLPKTQNTQTQTTLISEYDSDELLILDQFLPSTFSSQSVQTDLPNSFQNSQTQTTVGVDASQTQTIVNQSTQFDALNYWDMEFIDNQTQTVWNLDRHTQTDLDNFISNF